MTTAHRLFLCAALLGLPAALGAQTPPDSARQDTTQQQKSQRPQRRAFNMITDEDFRDMETGSAFDVVQRLRPNWMRQRGPTSPMDRTSGEVIVYVDGVNYGDVASLRTIPVAHISAIRFFSAADATTRFSVTRGGGVIEVYTRQQ